MNQFLTTSIYVLFIAALVSCSGTAQDSTLSSSSEDISASGAVAGVIGGALGASSSTGTLSTKGSLRIRASACPTVLTTAGSGCTQNGNAADMTYSACSFGSSSAAWSGTLEMTLSSGTAVNCGTFPDTSTIANNQSIQRQFVTAGAPGTATRTSSLGTVVTVDNASANLSNFDTGTTITANIGTGYGTQIVFDGSGHRKQVVVDERVYSTNFDESITGNVTLNESGSTRTITGGTMHVYHNKLQVVGTVTFTNVVYNDTCATPVSGSISVTYAAGAHVSPTAAGSYLVGKTETLAYTSCGVQVFTNSAGNSFKVSASSY